jgi:branched-chain amino acid transport system substrate-binding protein
MRSLPRLVLLAVAAVALCLPASAGALLTGPQQNFTIGSVFSQTGAGAPYGVSQIKGAQLGISVVNTGHLAGSTAQLSLANRDDASDAAKAPSVFTSLIDDGAVALLGPTLSSSALTADKVAQERGRPVLGVSNTIDGITAIGTYVFRNSLAESVVQPQTVKVAKRKLHLKRVAIVYATPDAYSKASNTVFRKALKKNGVKVVVDRAFASTSAKQLKRALDAAAKSKPDALVVSALQGDAVKAIIGARKRKALKKVPLIGGNAFNSPSLYSQTHGAAQGAISGTAWLAGRGGAGSKSFVTAYRARFHAAPDQFAAQAYAGVLLLADAIRRGGPGASSLRSALAATRKLPSILGPFSFDAAREPQYTPTVVQLHKGTQVAIG